MAKIIEGVPEFITREDYIDLIAASGLDPNNLQDLRFSSDGIHAVVFHRDEDGARRLDNSPGATGYLKHRIFIPVRDSKDDRRRTRIRPVKDNSRD